MAAMASEEASMLEDDIQSLEERLKVLSRIFNWWLSAEQCYTSQFLSCISSWLDTFCMFYIHVYSGDAAANRSS